ncbi:hypothetical protein AAMO2058_000703400 [Amorphochlora amoebiformis]
MATYTAYALAARDTNGVLKKMEIERRAPGEKDLKIKIMYCGVCHSDVHQIRAEWEQPVFYPMIPGHEMVGKVEEIGSGVSKFNVGDIVGVGVIVDSCRKCNECKAGIEQYCSGVEGKKDSLHVSYNCCLKDPENIKVKNSEFGELLHGGYCTYITCDENYVVSVPSEIPAESAGPLLCAGITTYSPMVHYGKICKDLHPEVKGKLRVGVVGLGGLGHMALKWGKAMGFEMVVISRSVRKKEKAMKMGASEFVISTDAKSRASVMNSLHLIIDTIAANHDPSPYFGMLMTDGILCLVGIPPLPSPVKAFDLIGKRRVFAGSCIGGIKETEDMMKFAAEKGVIPEVDVIDAKNINKKVHILFKNMAPNQRFVIDISKFEEDVKDPSWEVEDEPAIKHSEYHINPGATVYPKSAIASKSSFPKSLLAAGTGFAVVAAAVFFLTGKKKA